MKEAEMFHPIKDLLIKKGFNTVVAEVWGADVVGFNDSAEIVVEMKKTLNFKVLEQAFRHIGHAKYIYVAVQRGKNGTIQITVLHISYYVNMVLA